MLLVANLTDCVIHAVALPSEARPADVVIVPPDDELHQSGPSNHAWHYFCVLHLPASPEYLMFVSLGQCYSRNESSRSHDVDYHDMHRRAYPKNEIEISRARLAFPGHRKSPFAVPKISTSHCAARQ
ncbi:hypothetical protein ACMFMF_009495 [Clarireedia jacksonii]